MAGASDSLHGLMQTNTFDASRLQFSLSAVVSVVPGRYDVGSLTNWSQEEQIQLRYHGYPGDCYSLHVQEVFEATSLTGDSESLRLHFRESGRGVSGMAAISHARPLMKLRSVDLEEVGLRRAGSQECHQPAGDFMQDRGRRFEGFEILIRARFGEQPRCPFRVLRFDSKTFQNHKVQGMNL